MAPAVFFPQRKNAPSRSGQRAKTFAVPPLVRRSLAKAASCRSSKRRRGNGRTRSTPTALFPEKRFGCRLHGVFCGRPSPLSTIQGLSLQGRLRVLFRFIAVCKGYSIGFTENCQQKFIILPAFRSQRTDTVPPHAGPPC